MIFSLYEYCILLQFSVGENILQKDKYCCRKNQRTIFLQIKFNSAQFYELNNEEAFAARIASLPSAGIAEFFIVFIAAGKSWFAGKSLPNKTCL